MYAIIKIGQGQFKINEGDEIEVNNLNLKDGQELTIKEVLMAKDGKRVLVGTPLVEGASVIGTVLSNYKGKKLVVFKYKKRKHEKKKLGFRAQITRLKINKINIQ